MRALCTPGCPAGDRAGIAAFLPLHRHARPHVADVRHLGTFLIAYGYRVKATGHRFLGGRVLEECRPWFTESREQLDTVDQAADGARVASGGSQCACRVASDDR